MFYETFSEKKKGHKKWVGMLVIMLLVFACFLVAYIFSDLFIAKQVTVILLFACSMSYFVKVSKRKSLVIATLYQGLLLAVDYITYAVNGSLFDNYEITEHYYRSGSMLVIILCKVLLFLCVLIVKMKMGQTKAEILTDTEWIRFLFFPVFTIITITAMIATVGSVENLTQKNILLVIAFGMVGMNIVVFYLINDIVEREVQISKKEMFEVELKNQKQMYQTISENYDKQRRKVHEFKNEIMCIESLLIKNQYEELEKYISTIHSKLSKEKDAIDVNHVMINAIINTKYQEAINKGIVFVFRVNDLSNIRVSDEDIVVILANLLNNAIEACEKCSGLKVIKLKFLKEEEHIVLAVKNTSNENPVYENGIILTSKVIEPEEHGLGIRNVIHLIEAYHGSYVIKSSEAKFYFSIIIPNH